MSFKKGQIFSPLPRTTRGRPTVLKGDPKGKNFLYTVGNSVIIRDIENPVICDVYTQHSKEATVAVYAPSGAYIASGDVSGKIRIWDTLQEEHILKYEYQPLSGSIRDMAWSPDGKRIVVGGEGREKFAHVFFWDSGSSVGNLIGNTKPINAVDYRPTRPYRVCTASEDLEVGFFEGPPFKLHHSSKEHSKFVNCVKYSPDGERFASGGYDGQIFLYDGKTGEKTCDLGGKAHQGGIYGLSWSEDSKSLLSASADKTAKIWDIETSTASVEFTFGSQLEDQQLGCLWQKEHLLTVSLSGNINYLDRSNPSKPRQILQGHNKNILSMTASTDSSHLYSTSFDGRICRWKVATGEAERFKGQGHSNQVSDMALCGSTLATCSMDDTVRLTSVESMEYDANCVRLESMPDGIACGKDGLVVVACQKDITVVRNGKSVFSLPVDFEAKCVSVHPGQTEVAVGGKSNNLHIFTLDNDTLVEKMKLALPSKEDWVSDVVYSPDGAKLATAVARNVIVRDSSNYEISAESLTHTARVTCLAWSPDSCHIASGGLDTNLHVWTLGKDKIRIQRAHPLAVITRITWLDNNTIASCGFDCCIRFWTVNYD